MSIVEKALQKAQKRGRETSPTGSPRNEVIDSGNAAVPGPSEAPGPSLARRASLHESGPDRSELTANDLKPIVDIDVERLRSEGRMPPASLARQTDDEIRRVKWPLLKALTGQSEVAPARNHVVLVTSALPGEGKTYLSLNLALSIVRDRELRVILVDGDVARPGLTPSLGLDGAPGLNDVLENESMDVNEVTYRTSVDGLFVVPSGKWHEHSPEFFAGSRLPKLFEEMSRRVGRGVIILDSPPMLATNEAQAATAYVGHVLLVVQADKTEQRAVLEAIALVDKSTPVSAVLNRVEPNVVSRYYGHYYYKSGYGRYGEAGKGNA